MPLKPLLLLENRYIANGHWDQILLKRSKMQEWAASGQLPNAIGLQARQAPAIQYVKDLLAEGYVGKVLSANLKIFIDGMGGVGDKSTAYLFDRKVGGNLLTIVGGHNLDAFTYMLGDFTALSALTAQQFPEV
ncbi:hypothetical protein MF626_001329 [Paenibacillus polymyxa]|uniref:Gal80p-like C-terminal domain-containing protein n=1 Tax=Paenibacillus polymyxa TaxID=1406 RepID=A0AAE9IGK2_PAEPO|nr:hypothetical protein [Paenibacillus polymyxa]URJ51877.1 hypothetical protein MF626_001329 [Paenibacillus polymyxa]